MKYTTILLLFSLSFTTLQAQPYHPLVDEGNVWDVEWMSWEYYGGLIFYYDMYRYWLNGDTVINGYQYKKLFSQWKFRYVTNGYPQYDYWMNLNYDPELIAGLREDTVTKRVYAYDFGAFAWGQQLTGDTLFYDFDVSIGDTLKWSTNHCVVSGIDSFQMLNGELRQRITLDLFGSTHYWIEGIGATEVLSQPYFIYFEVFTQLTCFSHDGIQLYEDPPYGIPSYLIASCDSLATIASEIQIPDKKVTLNSNLTSQHFQFTFQDLEIKSARLQLVDVFGRIIFQQEVQSGMSYDISCSSFRNGVYIAQLIIDSNRKIWNGKICIQKN